MYNSDEIKKVFGAVVKDLRNREGLTQEQLSEFIGLQANGLTQIETGRNFVSSETLSKLCSHFNVASCVFFTPQLEVKLDEHVNYTKEINALLPTFGIEKLREIYNILVAMKK